MGQPRLIEGKQIIWWRNGQKTWTDTSPKKTSRWPTDTWKNAQYHSSSGKYKSKPQGDTTSHLSEWLTLTTQKATDVGKDAEKEDLFFTAGGNANWCSHSGKQLEVLKKLKMELPYDPVIALLGTYPRDAGMLFRRGTCTPMFIAALSTIAKVWKEPKCHRWMNG